MAGGGRPRLIESEGTLGASGEGGRCGAGCEGGGG